MNINEFSNCDCSPVSSGNCKQNGLLHWQILQEDYSKLPESYKNQGIVFFVKQKKEDKTGVIIRNNVVYSGGDSESGFKEVDGEENQIIVNDGEKWIRSSDFIAKHISITTQDLMDKNEDGTTQLDIQVTPSNSGIDIPLKIYSLKITDSDGESTEYITDDIINNIINKKEEGFVTNKEIKKGSEIDKTELDESLDIKDDSYYLITDYGNPGCEIKLDNENGKKCLFLQTKTGIAVHTCLNFNIKKKIDVKKSYQVEINIQHEFSESSARLNSQSLNFKFVGKNNLPSVTAWLSTDQENKKNYIYKIDTNKSLEDSYDIGVSNAKDLIFTNDLEEGGYTKTGGFFHLNQRGKLTVGEDARLTVHNNAWIDLCNNAQVKFSTGQFFFDSFSSDSSNVSNVYAPKFYMHGGFVDIGSNSFTAGDQSYQQQRRTGLPSYIDGPWLHLHQQAAIVMDDASYIKMADYGAIYADGHSSLYMKDYSRVDIENGSRVHISGNSLSTGSTGKSPVVCIDPVQIHLYSGDAITEEFGQSGSLPYYNYWNASMPFAYINRVNFWDEEGTDIVDWSRFSQNDSSSNNYDLIIENDTKIVIGTNNGGKVRTRIGAQSGGSVNFDVTSKDSSCIGIKLGAEQAGKLYFDLTSQGAKTYVKFGGSSGSEQVYDIAPAGDSHSYIKFSPNGGAIYRLIIDPDTGSKNYIKLGGGSNSRTQIIYDPAKNSTFDLKISPNEGNKMQFILTDNIFVQMSAKAHTEMHDDSTVVMRGPWLETLSNSLDGIVTKVKNKPWKDCGAYEGWRRPVSIKNGPLDSMYDQSGFMMRGVWDLEKDVNREEEVTIILDQDKDSQIINSTNDLTIEELVKSETFKEWQKENNKYYEEGLKYNWPDDATEEKLNDIIHDFGSTEVTIKNYIFTTCPPDWKPFIDKVEDSPLLQITDNADVRVSDNVSIMADKTGIEIKSDNTKANGESKTIKFTFEQLEKLLELVKKEISSESLA